MSCSQVLSGIAKDCVANIGGVKKVAIALYEDVESITVAGGIITTITMADSAKFKLYSFATGSASMTSTETIDKPNGVQFVTTDLVMRFNRMDTAKRIEIAALSLSELAVLVQDNNKKWWYLGGGDGTVDDGNPVTKSAGDGMTGAATTDSNAYNVTLQDIGAYPLPVTEDIVAALIDAAPAPTA